MRCKFCGQKLSGGMTVCPSCGKPVKRKNKTLLAVLFVFLFVVCASAALIILNLKGRGELPNLNFDSLRSLFSRQTEVTEPADLPNTSPDIPEVSSEVPAVTEAPVEEPSDEPAQTEDIAAPAESEAEAQEKAAPTVLSAYQAIERESFSQLLKAWAACRIAEPEAADKLLRGDGQLLLRLCLNLVLDEEAQSRMILSEAEGWSLFAAEDSNAPFRALLASEESDALLEEYFELALSHVTEVTLAPELLETEGIVENCSACYEADLDADTLHRIASSVIAALRYDKRIVGILGEKDIDALSARLDELKYKLDSAKGKDDAVLHMVLYVNEDGEFRGRSFSYQQENRPGRFLLALPRDGETLGLELSLRDSAGLRSLTGRGSMAKNAFSGSFRFLQDGKSLASASVETAE